MSVFLGTCGGMQGGEERLPGSKDFLTQKSVQVRMCCQFDNAVDVEVLPPYVPSKEEKVSPSLYAKNVQKLYAKTLNLPMSDQVLLISAKCPKHSGFWDNFLEMWPLNIICMQLSELVLEQVSAADNASGVQSQEEFRALVNRGVGVSWDGRKVVAPEGVVDSNGFVDLTSSTPKKSE
jgi:hypothetical protein